MQLNMFENGLDFILDSINHLKVAEKEDVDSDVKLKSLKYCVLHMSSGLELIFKHRLYMGHWIYVFADMNKAVREDLINGKFKSVDSETSIKRLENLCSVKFNKDDKNTIKDIRESRNRIEHFEFNETIEVVESKVNKTLNLLLKFIKDNYDGLIERNIINLSEDFKDCELTEKVSRLLEEITFEASKLNEHYEASLNVAQKRASIEYLEEDLVICPMCNENLLKRGKSEDKSYCYFCRYEDSGENSAKLYINKILHINEYEAVTKGEEYPLYECPTCDNYTLVLDNEYLCFSCGYTYEIKELNNCLTCGKLYDTYYDYEEIGICSECIEQR